MVLQEVFKPLRKCNKGSFELTKLWLEKAEEIELSATAVSVMTALLWHFNPDKKYVYPHQDTIAKRVKRSIATVKRAISELKQKGYIITTKSRNGNLYAFTKKFFDLFELPESQLCTVEKVKNEPCMNIEQIKEQIKEQQPIKEEIKITAPKPKKKVVAFSSLSSNKAPEKKTAKPLDLQAIPAIIRENKNIKNPQTYWWSLDYTAKTDYIRKEKEMLEAKERKLAKEKEKEKQSLENYKKFLERKNSKPFVETCTKEEAVSYIKRMFGSSDFAKKIAFKSTTVKQLQAKFGFNLNEILK